MFTFAFYQHDSMDKVVVAGIKYAVAKLPHRTVITVCESMDSEGYNFELGEQGENYSYGRYRECYITNESGRTIDRLEAPNPNACDPCGPCPDYPKAA